VIRELVLATQNPHKQQELKNLLGDIGLNILIIGDFPGAPDIEEDGRTCHDNAMKKARGIAQFTAHWALADDTGLEVDALNGRPGVYAARYAGEQATYEDNCRKLLNEMTHVPSDQRSARFITVMALSDPSGNVEVVEGILTGRITQQFQGSQGFGYDPVFFVPELGQTLAELSLDKKNQVSHRAQAFRKIKEILLKKVCHA
jgi:XTP/dITP diphosphohydrolase